MVFVRGDSPRLLEQVRIVEPTAFRTTLQGQSVIQVGRFNQAANADQRVRDLQAQGFGAEMAEVEASVPYYAQTPALPPNVYAANGDLPPLPVDVLPSAQGGESLPPMTATMPPTETLPSISSVQPPMAALPPASSTLPPVSTPMQVAQGPTNVEFGQELNYSAPPFPGDSPVNVTPSGTAAPFTPAQISVNAPYYVVIPTSQENLPAL
ncbi:MAG: SPOR domain-containing protein, partial [Leptolyngbyaceae cyanobacterium SM2_3_12]|nr:SPOR domain-containing protein [Leptolyngbyaceae cyanobacterium SM2_3_12]